MTETTVPVVPFCDLGRQHRAYLGELLEAAEIVFDRGSMLQGCQVTALEEELAVRSRRTYGIAVNSCTDALFFALHAAGVAPGDEVLVTDLSFLASASAIVRAGAVPVFVDIDPESLNMNLDHAATLITKRTTAIVAVHIFGRMLSPQVLEDFATRHHLLLIEDAAQAFGATCGKRPAASTGVASCLSFDPTKNLAAAGSGGMVLTDDPELASRVRALRYHGLAQDGRCDCLGYNSQMPTISAAILLAKLASFDEMQSQRRAIAEYYAQNLEEFEIRLPARDSETMENSWHKYVIRVRDRDGLREALRQRGIETRIHYPHPLHAHPAFECFKPASERPEVEKCTRESLSLPIYPFLTEWECQRVVEAIIDFLTDQS